MREGRSAGSRGQRGILDNGGIGGDLELSVSSRFHFRSFRSFNCS